MLVSFTDEALKNYSVMRALIEKLYQAGVLGFRRKARAMVGLFTVAKTKKENQLRLVVGPRVANALHRPLPHADLPTVGAFGSLDYSDDRLRTADAARRFDVHFAHLNLADMFYQREFEEVGSFFPPSSQGVLARFRPQDSVRR